VGLYAGPEYIIHFKYANILNVTYVTMTYGLGLPLLFPIAILSYLIFWLVERIQIAYTYRLPPKMDERMTKNAMRLFNYVPILFLFNGYWMLSNRQIFDNIVNKIELQGMQMESSHTWDTLRTLSVTSPILLICTFLVIISSLRTIFSQPFMQKWGYTISNTHFDVEENLPDFFDALKTSDK